MDAKEKTRFLFNWILTNVLVITGGLIVSMILGFAIFFGLMGYDSYEDVGTPFQQTLIMITGCVVTGSALGFFQKRLLRRLFEIPVWWIFSIPIGLVIVEVIAGIGCSQLGLGGRTELDHLPNVIIFSAYGLIVGTMQYFILRRHFVRSAIWIPSNILAYGLGMLVAGSVYDTPVMIATYASGMIILGAITGATLLWVLKEK